MFKRLSTPILFFLAMLIYIAFSGWLFFPYAAKITSVQRIFFAAPVLSAAAVYILSQRYVNSFVACFFAGIIYGFGPFSCGFYCFHPAASLLYALVPWTFIPAVFLYKFFKNSDKAANILAAILSFLPFIIIIAIFSLAAHYYFYPIPRDTEVSPCAFLALINPLHPQPFSFPFSFYHAPLAALLVGLVLFIKTRRYWVAILAILAIFLSLYQPIFNVPPVFWLSFIILFCSVTIAEGFEAIILAGRADSGWLIIAAAILFLQVPLDFLLGNPLSFPIPLGLSAISIAALLFIFFVARIGLALHYIRMFALYSAVFVDVIVITKNIIDKIFA